LTEAPNISPAFSAKGTKTTEDFLGGFLIYVQSSAPVWRSHASPPPFRQKSNAFFGEFVNRIHKKRGVDYS
jgi:hypothetical protein